MMCDGSVTRFFIEQGFWKDYHSYSDGVLQVDQLLNLCVYM